MNTNEIRIGDTVIFSTESFDIEMDFECTVEQDFGDSVEVSNPGWDQPAVLHKSSLRKIDQAFGSPSV